MKCKRVFTFIFSILFSFVIIFSGFVFPVSAARDPFLDYMEIYDISLCSTETVDYSQYYNPPVTNAGVYSRYCKTYTFPIDAYPVHYSYMIEYFYLRDSGQSNTLNIGLDAGRIGSFYFSPLRGYRFNTMLFDGYETEPHDVIDLRPYISAGYTHVDFKLDIDYIHAPAYLEVEILGAYGFYDVNGNAITTPNTQSVEFTYSSAAASGPYPVPYGTNLMEIPSGAVYMEYYGNIQFRNVTSTCDLSFDVVSCDLSFHKVDPSFVPGPQPTEPTEPSSGGSGSGSDSGSGSGSGSDSGTNYPTFDDSGIIDSVNSSADKIIGEIGSDISNQTDILTGAIGDQTDQIGSMIDGVRDDLDDVKSNLEDVNSNLNDANDKLDDANTTLTDTLDEVKSIPEKILDGITGLFVPNEEEMAEYNDRWSELLRSRFGALYESADIISSVGSAFTASVSEPTSTINFPAVSLDLAGAEFVFGGWDVQVVPDGFEVIVDMLKTMISVLATVAFVNALRNKLDRLMEGA